MSKWHRPCKPKTCLFDISVPSELVFSSPLIRLRNDINLFEQEMKHMTCCGCPSNPKKWNPKNRAKPHPFCVWTAAVLKPAETHQGSAVSVSVLLFLFVDCSLWNKFNIKLTPASNPAAWGRQILLKVSIVFQNNLEKNLMNWLVDYLIYLKSLMESVWRKAFVRSLCVIPT